MNKLKLLLSILFVLLLIEYSYAQDWANLKRFQEGNAKLDKAMADEQRVVFMGNSITESWLSIRPEFFAGKPYVNRGISGQTTPQMLLRFRQDVINLQPVAVVILAGINDIAGNTGPATINEIANNIYSMAELARNNNIKVVLCSVLPANIFGWKPGINPADKVMELNILLKTYAVKNKMGYVDYFSAMVNNNYGLKNELGSDGVHPNAAGYAIMEPLLEKELAKALD
jgi:lysophospholipase L1-like esterase